VTLYFPFAAFTPFTAFTATPARLPKMSKMGDFWGGVNLASKRKIAEKWRQFGVSCGAGWDSRAPMKSKISWEKEEQRNE